MQRLPGAAAGHMLLCVALACCRIGLLLMLSSASCGRPCTKQLSRIKFSCCEQGIQH